MDSLLLSSSDTNSNKSSEDDSSSVPTWKQPLSTSYTSGLGRKDKLTSIPTPAFSAGGETKTKPEENVEETQVIQILLPCIVCNRTFSPEALTRHSKVCTKVNTNTIRKPIRGTFDSAEQRRKDTVVADFIPPPSFDALNDNRGPLSRGSRNRSSLRGTSCTTNTRLSRSLSNASANNNVILPWKKERSLSQKPSAKSIDNYGEDYSEFGSNSGESQPSQATNSIKDVDTTLPSYARALSPSEDCPFCHRSFGHKAFDRHVSFCKEVYVRKQYENQPVPKEKEEALERQEIRTKYRPMKGSSSCSSLRSMSPPKDFASMALKFFGGLRRSDGSNNLHNKQNNIKNNLKKSNESLASSCYGDFNRAPRRTSPSPVRNTTTSNTNKINNLMSKSYLFNNKDLSKVSLLPMRVNTTSNIPKKTKSSESLPCNSHPYSHVPGSGYGQNSTLMGNNFSRNSRTRSSLHKNFFRSKRVEPEGTENTSTSALIITPMNFFSKTKMSHQNQNQQQQHEHYRVPSSSELMEQSRPRGGSFLTSDPSYDPYEKAAKQLEELLKTQPIKNNKRTQRKVGLDRAFQSVTSPLLGLNFDDSDGKGYSDSNDSNMDEKNMKTPLHSYKSNGLNPGSFSFEGSTATAEDSYWDQILQKSTHSPLASQTKSQQSDSSGSDNNKSRAVSNISSADSAFSRSDGADLEFEALESLMNLGNVPLTSSNLQQQQHQKQQPSSLSTTSSHASLSRILSPTPTLSSQSESHSSQPQTPVTTTEPEIPVRTSSLAYLKSQPQSHNQTEIQNKHSSSSSGSKSGGVAKFCHECGSLYPTSLAKFCSECGEKRVNAT